MYNTLGELANSSQEAGVISKVVVCQVRCLVCDHFNDCYNGGFKCLGKV